MFFFYYFDIEFVAKWKFSKSTNRFAGLTKNSISSKDEMTTIIYAVTIMLILNAFNDPDARLNEKFKLISASDFITKHINFICLSVTFFIFVNYLYYVYYFVVYLSNN